MCETIPWPRISIGEPGWFERAMTESPEERAYFAEALAGANEWRAEEAMRLAEYREGLMQNVAAQSFAPEGRYAYEFDGDGIARLTSHATEIYDDDDQYLSRIRVQAATRKL